MSRHDISNELWHRIAPFLCPQRQERRGRPAKDARNILNGVIWILRTGAPWRDLPEEYGPWQTVYKRFNAWSKSSLWGEILDSLSSEADLEAASVDGTYVRAHQHSAGAKGGPKLRPSAAVVAA
jgi:transposase